MLVLRAEPSPARQAGQAQAGSKEEIGSATLIRIGWPSPFQLERLRALPLPAFEPSNHALRPVTTTTFRWCEDPDLWKLATCRVPKVLSALVPTLMLARLSHRPCPPIEESRPLAVRPHASQRANER